MRGADGCAEKHLTFQYATQCLLLIFNIMSCSVGRLKALARACCFSAPPILRSRQSDAESSAACVVEGAQRTRGDSAQAFPFVRIVYLREVSPAGFYFTSIKKAARNGARCCMQCRQSVRWEQIVNERGRGALKCRWYAWRDKYFFFAFSTCTSAVVLFSQCVWRVSLMRGTGKHRAPRSAKRCRK